MLYDCWREIVRDFYDEIALRDLASGQKWTFAQLDSLAAVPPSPERFLSYPMGEGQGEGECQTNFTHPPSRRQRETARSH